MDNLITFFAIFFFFGVTTLVIIKLVKSISKKRNREEEPIMASVTAPPLTTPPETSPPSQFSICIKYTGDQKYVKLFQDAANRWSQIITGDLPDLWYNPGNNIATMVDDLEINVEIAPMDGEYGALGQAGYDCVRWAWDGGLPWHGSMMFDSSDVEMMYKDGSLYSVILHEMGHVFGIGTMWDCRGLKNENGNYIGPNALREYRNLKNDQNLTEIPVEQGDKVGTSGVHWDENIFKGELMTGYVNPPMALSKMTIASLEDLGYVVDYSKADNYKL
ncbi:MAG: leishmanolysin [Magnetococcus sp. YQC-3]